MYAVAADSNRALALDNAKVSMEVIKSYIQANLDLLSDEEKSVGIWLEVGDDQTYLDVSITLADHDRAVELGRERGELAICYLGNLTVEFIEYD